MTHEPAVGGIVVTTRDVTARTRAELLVADQAHVLTLIARGSPLPVTLGALCEVLERHVRGAVCGVLLVDRYRQILRLSAGPQRSRRARRRVPRRADRRHRGRARVAP